jgi:hypothetical protein
MKRKGRKLTTQSKEKLERSRKLRSLLFPPGAAPQQVNLDEVIRSRKPNR